MPLAREARAAEGAGAARAWSRSACSARSISAGRRRPRRPASASPAPCSPCRQRPKLNWARVRHAVEDTTKVTAMLYWLFFGSSALIGVYTLAGGTKLIQDVMTALPLGADRRPHPDPGHLDRPRLLHRLDRHPAADRADLRAGRRDARLRPGLARRAVLHEHADLLHLAAVRAGRLLSEGRDAARHHARRHLPVDLALPGAAGRRARPRDRLSADRALAAEHDGRS